MAHELDFSRGVPAIFSVKETPWHRFGKILPEAPSVDDAMMAAEIDYRVDLEPVYTRRAAPNGEGDLLTAVPDAFAVMRSDTTSALSVVGKRYAPIQNSELGNVLRPIVDSGDLSLETGGALKGGRKVWMLGRWNTDRLNPSAHHIMGQLGVAPFILITNSHDGTSAATAILTPVRVVCQNTLTAALSTRDQSVRVPHTGMASKRLIDATESLVKQVVGNFDTVAAQYKRLKDHVLDMETFEAIVLDKLAPMPKFEAFENTARLHGAQEKAHARRNNLRSLWVAGKGHEGDRSAWEAYNAVAEALDHDESGLWGVGRNPDGRVGSMVDGSIANQKQYVMANLLSLTK